MKSREEARKRLYLSPNVCVCVSIFVSRVVCCYYDANLHALETAVVVGLFFPLTTTQSSLTQNATKSGVEFLGYWVYHSNKP